MSIQYCLLLLIFLLRELFSKPILLEGPLNSFGLEAQNVVLRCRISDGKNSSITWYHDGTELPPKSAEYQQVSELYDDVLVSTLTFQLHRQREGLYFCNASDSVNWVASQHADVRIAFLGEHFILEPQDKTVSVGETVLLECLPPIGLPKPSVHWYKNNISVAIDERMQVSEPGILRIDRISWRDSGIYMCVAESYAFRRRSSAAILTVRQRPYFVESPISQSVPIYSSFELSCRAAGDPLPTVFWRREPPFMEIPFDRTRLLLKGTLLFTQVRLEDAGDYICRAVSSSGVIEAIAHISVVAPPGLTETPPSVFSVFEGDKVELHCSAAGSPEPEVRWIRTSPFTYYIADLNASDRVWVGPTGSLIIHSARPDDASQYECRASSPVGLTRTLTSLEVKNNPYLFPARVGAVSSKQLTVKINGISLVKIVCHFPVPPLLHDSENITMTWYFNGNPLHNRLELRNKTFFEPNGSLVIQNVDENDTGNYTCLIFNHIGRRYTTWTTELQVFRASITQNSTALTNDNIPTRPSNFTLTGFGDTWLSFRWSDLGEDSYSWGYKLFYLPVVFKSTDLLSTNRASLLDPSYDSLQKNSKFEPKLDNWLSSDLVRQKRVKLVKLTPDTGYWVEVRKVSPFGMGPGELFPRIVYTSQRPTRLNFAQNGFLNNTVGSDAHLGYDGLFIGTSTTGDYQDLLSNFQSILFEDMSVRSLTASEILVSWRTRSSGSILQQIDGFKLHIKPVPMSRCLAAVASVYTSKRDLITAFPKRDVHHNAANMAVHCSLSSDTLFDQVLRMSTISAVSVEDNGMDSDALSLLSPVERTVLITRSVSSALPVMKAVSGGLLPFTCYEVEIGAFKDDATYGRIWSRTSQPELALTLDSSPSYAPQLLTADWLPDTDLQFNYTNAASEPTFNQAGVRLTWKPLDIRLSHGVIVGYMIHFLTNESDHSRSFKVPADHHSRDVFGLSPHLEYTIYMAGVTCRGEGVRGPGYQLPVGVSLRSGVYQDGLIETDAQIESTRLPLWAYGIIVAVIVFWILVGLFVPLIVRQKSTKRPLESSPTENASSSFLKSHAESSNGWRWCMFCEPIGPYHAQQRKTVQAFKRHATQPNVSLPDNIAAAAAAASHRNQVEMETLLQHSSDSPHTSSCDKSLSGRFALLDDLHRPSGTHRGNGSNPRGDMLCQAIRADPDKVDRSGHLMGDEAEVYANSDPSSISDPNSLVLGGRTGGELMPKVVLTSTKTTNECFKVLPNRPQLPESINIPFPKPPAYHSTIPDDAQLQLISNPNTSEPYSNGCVPHLSRPNHDNVSDIDTYPHPAASEEAVPPYASCTVLSVTNTTYPITNYSKQHTIPSEPAQRMRTVVECATTSTEHPNVMSQSLSNEVQPTGWYPMANPISASNRMTSHWFTPTPKDVPSPGVLGSFVASANPLHTIPPPPEYPPPPLPSWNQHVHTDPSKSPLYTHHSPGTGHSSNTTLDFEGRSQRFIRYVDGGPNTEVNCVVPTPGNASHKPLNPLLWNARSANPLADGGSSSERSATSSVGGAAHVSDATKLAQLRRLPNSVVVLNSHSGSDSSGSGAQPPVSHFDPVVVPTWYAPGHVSTAPSLHPSPYAISSGHEHLPTSFNHQLVFVNPTHHSPQSAEHMAPNQPQQPMPNCWSLSQDHNQAWVVRNPYQSTQGSVAHLGEGIFDPSGRSAM